MGAKPPWNSEIYGFQGVFRPQRALERKQFLNTPLNIVLFQTHSIFSFEYIFLIGGGGVNQDIICSRKKTIVKYQNT